MVEEKLDVTIVPHTHWDREWYLPFQFFRSKLVKLIDHVMDITENHEFPFMLDGQTIVLEDYLEIKPENKERLMKLIQEKKIAVGPWYLLPDEWLIGAESFIRNLEISLDLAKEFSIPLMPVAYLPDQFGHTRAIPQILSNLTTFNTAVLWRGVGPEITTVPFTWKSEFNAQKSILGVYMPFGYGNAADLPEAEEDLIQTIKDKVEELRPFSPLPHYLLMYGTDHQFPNPKIIPFIKLMDIEQLDVDFGTLDQYVTKLRNTIISKSYNPLEYTGEFRSSARAPLLQDTYSARIWIKQWNQKIEDLLTSYTEPLLTHFWIFSDRDYPDSYMSLAWKWLVKNHTHDGICGCSVDQTHDEMISRFSWAESIAKSQFEELKAEIEVYKEENSSPSLLVYNPSNAVDIPALIEFEYDAKTMITGIKNNQGQIFPVQTESSSEDVLFENTFSPIMLKAGLKLLPGRKITDFYINEQIVVEDLESGICNVTLICGKVPIGDFDVEDLKKKAIELIESKNFKKFHVKASLGKKQKYTALATLSPWSFNKFEFTSTVLEISDSEFTVSKNTVSNKYYEVSFNNDGTFDYYDKIKNVGYDSLHKFEDWGDKGDEYTFGRIGPESVKVKNIKREIVSEGSIYFDIKQTCNLEIFECLSEDRKKRIGKVEIPVETLFRFYKEIPIIEFKTKLTNTAKDHRLRICFDLPFSSFETQTSTHFGTIKRNSTQYGDETYSEAPSGIQAQKRYIRINDTMKQSSITLMNKGLPEVELVEGCRLALTLVRSIGYLSRMDFDERPLHAGPFLETPGAQVFNKEYLFEYGILIHSKKDPMYFCDNYAEVFSLGTKSFLLRDINKIQNASQSLFFTNNPWLRISSIRKRNGKLLITVFNLNTVYETTTFQINSRFTICREITYDRVIKSEGKIKEGQIEIAFNAYEIKMLEFE